MRSVRRKVLIGILVLISVLFLSAGLGLAGGSKASGEKEKKAVEKEAPKEEVFGAKLQKRLASRPPAKQAEPLTPSDFPTKFLPGIDKPGVVPKKRYFVVYSNGDMNDLWRLNHVKDMEAWGNRYNEQFGIKFMWANAGNNSAKQVSDIESLLALQPDLLILSANEAEPLSVIFEMCQELEVPFITVDRGIARPLAWEDPNDMYICHISMDFMYQGVVQGKKIVEYLTNKYGKPIGNVVELAGLAGSEPAIHRSIGLNLVLDNYPDIRIIASRPTAFDRKKSYEIMRDWLETYPPGSIDAVAGSFDEGILGALQAIKEAGRDELVGGPLFGIDGVKEFLENIVKGETNLTTECPPYFGMLAFEYGLRYLNGEKIPGLVMLPLRTYSRDNLDILKKHLELMEKYKKDFPLVEWGGHDQLSVDVSDVYPKNWVEDPSLLEKPYYQTDPPIEVQ